MKVPIPTTYVENETLQVKTPGLQEELDNMILGSYRATQIQIHSYLLNLRHIRFVNISLESSDQGMHMVLTPLYEASCVYCTTFYFPHVSNIHGRQHDVDVDALNTKLHKDDNMRSVLVNMSACRTNVFTVSVWRIRITPGTQDPINNIIRDSFPTFVFNHNHQLGSVKPLHPSWSMSYVVRPANIPPVAIWKLHIEVCDSVSHTCLEIPIDKRHGII